MSKNPFSPQNQGELKLKRNAYDLSRQSLFTTDFGRMSPAFIQEVIPGDSFEISSSLAIQGMPTVFPLQTRCRVSVEYYYGRNRCVMDEFEDFIFKTKDIEHPWLRMNDERAKKMISTGSLGDLFGLPTTVGSDSFVSKRISFSPAFYDSNRPLSVTTNNDFLSLFYSVGKNPVFIRSDSEVVSDVFSTSFNYNAWSSFRFSEIIVDKFDLSDSPIISFPLSTPFVSSGISHTSMFTLGVMNEFGEVLFSKKSNISVSLDFKSFVFPSSTDVLEFANSVERPRLFVAFAFSSVSTGNFYGGSFSSGDNTYYLWPSPSDYSSLTSIYPIFDSNLLSSVSHIYDSTDDSFIASNPFVGNSPDIKVNALPFRHYEMICNYYARNDKNNPYMLNGEPQYNEFIPTHAAGADDNLYDYHYRNWELDRFTSSVQSPQFGEAPLVGLTYTGSDTVELVFNDADGNPYTAEVGVDVDNVVTTIQNFSKDIPSANLRKLQEMIHYGISINDLRVTNSFQRFLENVLRRGLRYRNQLKSHFGVGVDYPDIDIPQYIGGYSGELVVSKITSTAQTSEANLGDFNGQLSGMIQSKHKIHCYCPEHGFIIGIVCITPIPVYTQVADKSMIKNEPFDYFLPEFGKIGFVPVHYSEVMPLQTPVDGSVNDVFGYQKAWYDYMQSLDSAHGYFRTNLKDFVLQRVFSERPDLVEDFTVINPEQLTDVFVSGNIADKYNMSDKFLCNFYNHVVAKRPIPRIGTPSLE